MNEIRKRLVTVNVPHDPALHRIWPLMRLGVGVAMCWRGRIRGAYIAPRFRGV